MQTFIFTYGTEGQPFVGGWTEVIAPDLDKACEAFRIFHPDKNEGFLNCSSVYTAEKFMETSMGKNGDNFGRGCWEVIGLCRVSGGAVR